MRRPLLGVAVLAVALLALPLAPPGPATAAPHPVGSAGGPAAPAGPALGGAALLRTLLHNETVRGAASTPTSGYQDTAAPPLPHTAPTVVSVVTNGRGCCDYVNETPPGGPWDAVVLNYTGTAVNGVYDSSFRASVDGVQVLFGTTPEYGTWTVLDNITEYESLLEPGANFTFLLSAAVLTGGYFETSLTLSFYPAPAGGPLPSEPTKIVPLWDAYIKPTVPTLSVNASVPSDTSAATLELWMYGFGSDGGDEFWWASPTPHRALEVSVDGAPFAAVYPFPYVNTGGVDLFLWRPIPAAFTLSDRPFEVNVSGALGALEGLHEYNASIEDRNVSCPWYTAGALLLWTNASIAGATLTAGHATFPLPSGVGTVSSSTSFAYRSTLTTSNGTVALSSDGSGTFRETTTTAGATGTGTSWQNLTQASTFSDTTSAAGPNGTTYANDSRAFTFGTDLGGAESVSTATGTYPEYGNVTSSMLNFDQDWAETDSVLSIGTAGRAASTYDLDNEVLGANGVFDTEVEIPSMGSQEEVIAYPLITSSTPTYTAESSTGTGGYSHVMAGSDYDPTNPDLAETLLANRFDSVALPLAVGAVASPDPVDAGHATVLAAMARGGDGVDTFSWSDLPPGCASSNSSVLVCTPTVSGTFAPVVSLSDSLGDVAASTPAVLVVEPALNATVVPSSPGADLGGTLTFAAAISGGAAPFACAWTVEGVPTSGTCAGPVAGSTETVGAVAATVSVTDATGATVNATSASVPVSSALEVRVTAQNASVDAGSAAIFTLSITGGTAPYEIVWLRGSAAILGANGTTLTLVPDSTGTLTVSARVTDAAEASQPSNAVSVQVNATAPSGGANSTGSSGSGSLDAPLFWAVIGLAAVAGVEAVLLVAKSLPPRRS